MNKFKNKNTILNLRYIGAGTLAVLLGISTSFALSSTSPGTAKVPGFSYKEILLLALTGSVILVSVLVLVVAVYALTVIQTVLLKKDTDVPQSSFWANMDKKLLTQAVPIQQEKDILLEHEYDGIQELDNHLPPWWLAMFYMTVVFGIGYMMVYHILGWMPLSADEYEITMAKANQEVAEYKAMMGNSMDENTVEITTEEVAIQAGQTLFLEKCSTCHGEQGQGGIGPNMTDEYWIHGGDVKDLFKTIKYGAKNGMQSWEGKISPQEMQNVASFILTKLQGTNPADAKDPEGKKYEREKEEKKE